MLHVARRSRAAVEQQIKNRHAMRKFAAELRVFRIAGVIEPADLDPAIGEGALVDVILGRGTGNVFRAAGLCAKISKTLALAVDERVIPRVAYFGRNAQVSTDELDQVAVERR